MHSLKGNKKFKMAAINLIVKTTSEEEVEDLRAQFRAIDTDETGMIKASELQEVLIERRMNLTDTEIREIVDQMDYQNDEKVNYNEFLAKTIDVRNILKEQRLQAISNQFDEEFV